jgi:hypothetical protein
LQVQTNFDRIINLQHMLKKFDMNNAKPIKTPMPSNGHIDLIEEGKSVDQKVYRSIIGSLLHHYASRPDIIHSVFMCARFQSNPKECHIMDVKRISRYFVHTPNLGLWYPKGSTFDLLGYMLTVETCNNLRFGRVRTYTFSPWGEPQGSCQFAEQGDC